ncbi:hypothetical protein PF003_g38062 [Phytophthora fragariae]|nr:hypothetical protein PF003_g38062 [Phytophthora fragariae]
MPITGPEDAATADVEVVGVDAVAQGVVVLELEARLSDKEGRTAPHDLAAPASSAARRSIKSWAAQTSNPARPNACWRNCAHGARLLQLPCVESRPWPSLAMKLGQRKSHPAQLKREWMDWKFTLSSLIRGPTSRWSPRASWTPSRPAEHRSSWRTFRRAHCRRLEARTSPSTRQ